MEEEEASIRRIYVEIHNAENLPNKDVTSKSDPFVTVEIDGKEVFKTRVIKNQLNPVWEASETFKINKDVSKIKFVVRDKNLIGSEVIGKVSINFEDLKGGNDIIMKDFILKDSNKKAPAKLKLSLNYREGKKRIQNM